MKSFLALLALSFCQLLPAAEIKLVELPPAHVKADKTSELVFAISTAKEIEIIALDPIIKFDENKKCIPPKSAFHGFAILATARVTDTKEIQRLAESLGKAINAGKSSALCFSPRHALRIKKSDCDIDVVVCFECSAAQVHGLTGLGYTAITPALAQHEWESIFATHLSTKS
jgi:hypothetical protein